MSRVDTVVLGVGADENLYMVERALDAAGMQLKKEGLSMLLVEQNLPFALKLADYVYVMSKGRIVYESSAHVLAQNEDVKARHLGVS